MRVCRFGAPALGGFFNSPGGEFSRNLKFLFLGDLVGAFGFDGRSFVVFCNVLAVTLCMSSVCGRSRSFAFSVFLFFTINYFIFTRTTVGRDITVTFNY